MDNYITGNTIKKLRERKKLTQSELADIICVSDKTVSKWETGKGLPDITLIEPLASALGVSVIELMQGEYVINQNRAGNMLNSNIYVCPVCGNVLHGTGAGVVSCCGITLPPLKAEYGDCGHEIDCKTVENEYFISIKHEMTKAHYISFIAYVTSDRLELVKLYPEQHAEVRFLRRGHGVIYAYCNKDGLIKTDL